VALLLYIPFGIGPSQWLHLQLNVLLSEQYVHFMRALTFRLRKTYPNNRAMLDLCEMLIFGSCFEKKLLLAFDEMNVLASTHTNQFVQPSARQGFYDAFKFHNNTPVIGEHDSLRSLSG
jgi:hypothetical protein